MEKIADKLIDLGLNAGLKLLYAMVIVIVGMKLTNLLIRGLKKGHLLKKLDGGIVSFLLSFIKITLYIVLFISAASVLGVPLTSMITLLGSAGLAIGLSLQGGLSNIAGGLIILLFKPFKVGDYIDTHADSGTVKTINLFYTTLKTPDNKIISIPNGNLANEATVNYSKEAYRRLDIDFGVSYKSNNNSVKKALQYIIDNDNRIIKDKDKTPFIAITNLADSSVMYTIRVWVKSDEYWNLKFDLLEKVKNKFDSEKIEIPYPQLDVHIEK